MSSSNTGTLALIWSIKSSARSRCFLLRKLSLAFLLSRTSRLLGRAGCRVIQRQSLSGAIAINVKQTFGKCRSMIPADNRLSTG
jgi:hypothetical protein